MLLLAVSSSSPEQTPAAQDLARELDLPFTNDLHDDQYAYLLILTPNYLGLQKTTEKRFAPFYIDFLAGKMAYRSQQASRRKELLARAIGLKPSANPTIVDATAGLGRDSFILASLGYQITLLERSPILVALLKDTIQRTRQSEQAAAIVERMHLIPTDAITWFNAGNSADVIYLDPMFPERKKSAAVKKEMVLLQSLLPQAEDEETLLETALGCACKRVVVKRPRLASYLGPGKPSFSLSGNSSRFDIYLVD